MADNSIEASLKVAFSAAKKALTAAKELHDVSTYPEEMTKGLDELPFVDILSVKSSMLARYMMNLHNIMSEDNDDEVEGEEGESVMKELEEVRRLPVLLLIPLLKPLID